MLKKIFVILGDKRKKRIINLQVFIVFSSILELVGVTSILPLMAIVNKQITVDNNTTLSKIAYFFHIETYVQLVIFSGVAVLILMVLSSIISVLTLKISNLEINKMGVELSNELFASYLRRPWTEHLSYRSSRIMDITNNQVNSFTGAVLLPLLTINSKILLIFMFCIMLLIVNPLITLLSIFLFSLMYGFVFLVLKDQLKSNSVVINKAYRDRIKVLNEAATSIKYIILKKLKKEIELEFYEATEPMALAIARNAIYISAPRYLVEMIAYVGIVLTIVIVFIFQNENLENIVSLLFLFALSALKLLPAAQQVYSSLSQIRGGFSTTDILYKEVITATEMDKDLGEGIEIIKTHGFKSLSVEKIYFTYPGKKNKVINGVSFNLEMGKSIAFVGPSGSGKSTLVDMILGLLEPQQGSISISANDGNKLKPVQVSSLIGYVPQSIEVLDRTVTENVAFGIPKEKIDHARVREALRVAQCEFVYELQDGLDTILGERGIELSGGQRQRIAIARSMYDSPEILVFDEATSALDGQTEKAIIKVINELPKKMTKIMIAHRLTTVKDCNVIYFLEKGKIVDQGTYDELYQKNEKFKLMTN